MSSIALPRVSVPGNDAADEQLFPINPDRKGGTIHNATGVICWVGLGEETVTPLNFTVRMVPDAYYELPFGWIGEVRFTSDTGPGGDMIGQELE